METVSFSSSVPRRSLKLFTRSGSFLGWFMEPDVSISRTIFLRGLSVAGGT